MPTLNQLIRHGREEKRRTDRTRVSDQCPQKQGVRPRVPIPTRTPKKPNSALRKIAKVRLSNRHDILAHIPGEGHNLQEHPMVLIRGGRVRVTRVIFRPPQPLPDPDDDYSTNPSDYSDSWDEMEVDPSSSEEESEDSDDYSTNPSDYSDSWDEMEVDPSWSEEEEEEEWSEEEEEEESSAESDGYSADDEFGF